MRGLVNPTITEVCRQSPGQPAALAFGNLGLSREEECDLLRQCRSGDIYPGVYPGVPPWPGHRLEAGDGEAKATR